MSAPPAPSEIFDRAAAEGERRLDQSLLELVSTGFIAGFTILFGIAAQAITHAAVAPEFGEVAKVAGALAFGLGVVLLVVGRAELFNENFFDPTAAVARRRDPGMVGPLVRLWMLTFVFNLVGGGLFALVLSVDGSLPPGTAASLQTAAESAARRDPGARFASAIAGGTLVSLLSFMLAAVDGDASRLALAYAVGFLLALGPFDHVVVTTLHLGLGWLYGASIGIPAVAEMALVATIGNLGGGVGLVTTTHVAQAMGE